MDDPYEPANSNKTLSDVTTNADRQLAARTIGNGVELLKLSGVRRDMLAEVLFRYVIAQLIPPPEDYDDRTQRIWYAQVLRFIEELEEHQRLIEEPSGGTV